MSRAYYPRLASASRDSLGLFVGGTGSVAFLLGLAPMVNLLTGPIGLMCAVAALAGALLFVVAELRQERSMTGIALELVLIGGFTFVVMYGVMWYFFTYVPAHPSVMQLKFGTPVPK